MALRRLKDAAEKAKIELSSTSSSEINLPYIMPVDGVPKHLVRSLSQAKFEQLADALIKRTIEPCASALKAADLDKSDIDEVIFGGRFDAHPRGSSRSQGVLRQGAIEGREP